MLTPSQKLDCIAKVRAYEVAAANARIHEIGYSNTGGDVQTAVGVQGVNHYLGDVGFPGGGQPWCAALQFSAVDDSHIDLGFRSASCPEVEAWARRNGILYTQPADGDFALFQEWDSQGQYSGHIEFVDRVNGDGTFASIGGNTGPAVGTQDDGGGVYRKTHSVSGWLYVRWVDMVRTMPAALRVEVDGAAVDCHPSLEGGHLRGDVRVLVGALGFDLVTAPGESYHGQSYIVVERGLQWPGNGTPGLTLCAGQIQGAPVVENGVMRAEVRYIAEALGYTVDTSQFAAGVVSLSKSVQP